MDSCNFNIPNDLLNRVSQLNSTLLCDGLVNSGAMDYMIKPVTAEQKVSGPAFTVSLEPGDNLFLHEAIHTAPEGSVLVVDGKGYEHRAYLGELMAFAAKAKNLKGIIIDGLVRDYDVLSKMEFPIFAKGFIPAGPFKEGPGSINQRISCGGIVVNPGDFIIGDTDGVVVIPRDELENTILSAEKKSAYETSRVEEILKYSKLKSESLPVNSIEPTWLREKMKKFEGC
ncbi:RraA family protein [Sporosarcina highlanderae]|uniref:Putative 4-hydroxy-4-methyl-2-oxoglutarate aldolase n=1 Tax=Sporosarcina highlanderae TaxID=3035916 RepID=A0ABT8JL56_9BACL|nr:RraA family protein [Sporosarcina highlanderae]MDN4605875.1 RraA family protein [Sporosarcina highlanderae]